MGMKKWRDLPEAQGLYDPRNEHDACGIGFVANIRGERSYGIVDDALKILENLKHRGGEGADHKSGDGAGILTISFIASARCWAFSFRRRESTVSA